VLHNIRLDVIPFYIGSGLFLQNLGIMIFMPDKSIPNPPFEE
jgi:hypothetical protein